MSAGWDTVCSWLGVMQHVSFLLGVALFWIFAVSVHNRSLDLRRCLVPSSILIVLTFITASQLSRLESSDALEEVIGLDVAYKGGITDEQGVHDDETNKKMEEYIKEYEHRKAEKALFFEMNDNRLGSLFSRSPLQASSLHQESIHGSSFHGRKITSSSSLDASKISSGSLSDSQQRLRSRNGIAEKGARTKNVTGDVENWVENATE